MGNWSHVIAQCLECDWSCDCYRTAQNKARKHSRQHGHRVQIEVGKAYVYEWKPSCTKEPTNNEPDTD